MHRTSSTVVLWSLATLALTGCSAAGPHHVARRAQAPYQTSVLPHSSAKFTVYLKYVSSVHVPIQPLRIAFQPFPPQGRPWNPPTAFRRGTRTNLRTVEFTGLATASTTHPSAAWSWAGGGVWLQIIPARGGRLESVFRIPIHIERMTLMSPHGAVYPVPQRVDDPYYQSYLIDSGTWYRIGTLDIMEQWSSIWLRIDGAHGR